MLQFGLRLGARPRQVITTTPRPLRLLKRIMADPTNALVWAVTTLTFGARAQPRIRGF